MTAPEYNNYELSINEVFVSSNLQCSFTLLRIILLLEILCRKTRTQICPKMIYLFLTKIHNVNKRLWMPSPTIISVTASRLMSSTILRCKCCHVFFPGSLQVVTITQGRIAADWGLRSASDGQRIL